MRSHPLPEARQYADLMLEELRKVIPSFLQRVDRPDRGGAWSEYLDTTRRETGELVERLFPDLVAPDEPPPAGPSGRPSVTLLDFDPDGEAKVIAAICAPLTDRPEEEVRRRVDLLGAEEKRSLLRAYVGERSNRRHRPGRAFERTGYRFDVVTDYGAFRDLQRHRMLTIEWQPLGVGLGTTSPTWSPRPAWRSGTWRRWSGPASWPRRWRRRSRCRRPTPSPWPTASATPCR